MKKVLQNLFISFFMSCALINSSQAADRDEQTGNPPPSELAEMWKNILQELPDPGPKPEHPDISFYHFKCDAAPEKKIIFIPTLHTFQFTETPASLVKFIKESGAVYTEARLDLISSKIAEAYYNDKNISVRTTSEEENWLNEIPADLKDIILDNLPSTQVSQFKPWFISARLCILGNDIDTGEITAYGESTIENQARLLPNYQGGVETLLDIAWLERWHTLSLPEAIKQLQDEAGIYESEFEPEIHTLVDRRIDSYFYHSDWVSCSLLYQRIKQAEKDSGEYDKSPIERTKNWIPKIQDIILHSAAQTIVFISGFSHYIGEEGLVTLLSPMGKFNIIKAKDLENL